MRQIVDNDMKITELEKHLTMARRRIVVVRSKEHRYEDRTKKGEVLVRVGV